MLTFTLAAPAIALPATPEGAVDTPGVWGTHTVSFISDQETVAAEEVATGNFATPEPAVPKDDEVFIGWFADLNEDSEPFDFENTAITADLTLTAQYRQSYTVQFLAPALENEPVRVITTEIIAQGESVANTAPDVPGVPTNYVFTGEWYEQHDQSRTPVDLSEPVDENKVLAPVIEPGFAITFVTFGTAEPTRLITGEDAIFTESDLANVPTPSRLGYEFIGWQAEPDNAVPITFPITEDQTLYASWNGLDVRYDVSYWLEKSNIVSATMPNPVFTPRGQSLPAWGSTDGALSTAQIGDPNNYDFLEQIPAVAPAGSLVSGPTQKTQLPATTQALVQAQLDPTKVHAAQPLLFADLAISEQNVTVLGDGSTVVNVYLTRTLWRSDFPLFAPGCNTTSYDITMNVGGTTFYQSETPVTRNSGVIGTYSVRTKIGLNVLALGFSPNPIDQATAEVVITAKDAGTDTQSCILIGWGPITSNLDTFHAVLTGGTSVNSTNLTQHTSVMNSGWYSSDTRTLTEGMNYVEAIKQTEHATTSILNTDGTPNPLVRIENLYNNNRVTVRAQIPTGHQNFETLSKRIYWASRGDRQIYPIIDGFTSYVGYGVGANTVGNGFQLDNATGRLYQLNNSGNTNDYYRYFVYSRNTYDLTFDTSGGTQIPTETAVPFNADLNTYEPADPIRGNDVFQGWFLDSAFERPFDFSDTQMPYANLILYAKWLLDPHTVEFFSSPADTEPLASLTEIVEDQAPAANPGSLPPQPSGSTFLGWFERTPNGYFVPWDFGTAVGSDLKLYARWQQPTDAPFEVSYQGNGNTSGSVPTDSWGYNAEAAAIVAPDSGLAREQEQFVGWRIAQPETGSTRLFHAGETVPINGNNLTLIAVYAASPTPIEVTFFNDKPHAETVKWSGPINAQITYPDANDVSFTGPATSTFLGWSTDPNATEADPAFDRLEVGELTEGLQLYAIWSAPLPISPETPGPSPSIPETGAGNPVTWLVAVTAALMLTAGAAVSGIARRARTNN